MTGLVGSLIPLGAIYLLYHQVIEYVMGRFEMLSKLLNFLPLETIFNVLTPISVIVGVGIGFLGSITTVRKHLHV